jgi:flagellar biosynthesis/type III secretory pathway protein FliH
MAGRLRLETFEILDAGEEPRLMLPEDIEEIRLAAYERGYGAGWEDAQTRAATLDHTRRAEAEAALERVSYSYNEACGQALAGLAPLFEAMFAAVLPAAVQRAVIPSVIEHLLPLARSALMQPLNLAVAPGQAEAFRAAMSGLILPPLDLVEDAALQPGQARIAVPETGEIAQIDLDGALAAMHAAFDRFHPAQPQEQPHAASR